MEVSVYYKNGKRAYYSNVAQITNITGENLVLDFITDFNDHMSRIIKAEEVERLGVKFI